MKCKVCDSQSNYFATAQILNKYDISYFQCSNCGFIQTEEPYWLEEAYSNAIAMSDVGLVFRNLMFSDITSKLIFNFFDHQSKFLDYGAGYGLFVRLMRDNGFDFYWFDKFCNNLFAQSFEINLDAAENNGFEIVTAFEVFEHLIDPSIELENLLKISSTILFSTELLPVSNPKPNDWWYYVLHEGQHISIYTHHSLRILAERYDLNFYSNGSSLHLLTKKELPCNPFEQLSRQQLKKVEKSSLINQDFNNIIEKYFQSNSVNSINTESSLSSNLEASRLNSPLNIIIDGVFFQMFKTGIARVWQSLFLEWAVNGFGQNIIVLDRAETAPKIAGIRYLSVPSYDYSKTEVDRQMLQEVCDQEAADLFVSTYYTTPLSTPSVFIAYDMIPEILGANLDEPMWREKHLGIAHASAYISISESTANDLVKLFPNINSKITVAHCGISNAFYPAPLGEIIQFKTKYGINKPYFILVGAGSDYKNAVLFFRGFSQLYSKSGFDVICTGAGYLLGTEYRELAAGSIVHSLYLSDEELRVAYSGATALVYPSKYEGFGMPVAEALACGCPVITCANASIPEVAGEAAIYIKDDDIDAMTDALCEVQKFKVRNSLMTKGLEQAKQFSWSKMADTISSALINATLIRFNLREINLVIFPDWSQPEEVLYTELANIIKTITTHPNRSKITLLIDHQNISDEDANLALSSVMMNLLMEEELELDDSVEIVLMGQLNSSQWSALCSQLQGRIKLNAENQACIDQLISDHLRAYSIETLPDILS
jgi:glycosyltransferase involved in cell wall biosynthesis